jgi:preprotein translocase subunit SecE
MATQSDKDEKVNDAKDGGGEASSGEELATTSPTAIVETDAAEGALEGEEGDEQIAHSFGSERYVHAAFFLSGILAAYLASKTLVLAWNSLAGWPAAVRAVPQLVSYTEEQRDSMALIAGAAIGTLLIVQAYRKEKVRTWANDVAAELSKVTWPTREAVLNGTLVVVVASTIATVYVTILDRIWSFLTTLVYGA